MGHFKKISDVDQKSGSDVVESYFDVVGSNNVSGISFSIDKRSKFQDQARKLAIDDARRRAQVYADRAGVRLGKTRSISEQLNQVIRPQPMARMAMDESVPVAMGEQDIQAAVSVVYEIVPKLYREL